MAPAELQTSWGRQSDGARFSQSSPVSARARAGIRTSDKIEDSTLILLEMGLLDCRYEPSTLPLIVFP